MAGRVRAVEDIQAAIRDATERLERTVTGLALREHIKELEAHHPEDLEPMAADEVCPSVAWLAHGDLEHAAETLTEALAALRRAGSRTAESVRDGWRRLRLEDVED